MRGSVGIIIGETGTLDFKFLVSDSTAVMRGHYVKIWHETDSSWVLAQVMSITRSSGSFSVEEAKKGKRNNRDDDHIVAEANVIGSRGSDGLLRSPMTPFSPGDPIYVADDELIRNVLGLVGGDMYVGLLDGTNIPVQLDANNLVQKHCSILAKTGSGKSYTAAVLLEELLEHNVPLLIIDPHSEYASLKEAASNTKDSAKYKVNPKGYGSKVKVYTPANKAINSNADELFRLNGVNLKPKELIDIFPDNYTTTHTGILYESIHKLRAEVETYFLEDIIREVANNESKARWNVINLLEDVNQMELLSPNPTPVEDLMQEGKANIIDLKGVPPDIQSMLVAKLCESLFEARKMGRIPPGMLVVEEAHNFAPERGFSKSASSEILRTIASEGRKFGLGMMIISQRPARVDKNVLSQCGTQIIMKVTNPNDLKSISKGLEGANSYVEDELLRLPPGVAMLVSNDIERPVLVDVRVRRSKHGGESVNVLKSSSGKRKSAPKKVAAVPAQPSANSPPAKREPTRKPKSGGGEKGLFKKLFGSEK